MKPLLITYTCTFCGNTHQEIIFSSDKVYELRDLRCNQCKDGRNVSMSCKEEEITVPIIGQVR